MHSYTPRSRRGGWRHTAFTVNQIIGQHAMNSSIHTASHTHAEVKMSNTGYPIINKMVTLNSKCAFINISTAININ